MNETVKKILKNILVPIAGAGIVLLIWYVTAQIKNDPLVLPYPKEVFERFFMLWQEKNFYKSIFSTLGRTFLCFFISLGSAVLFAVLAELWKPFDAFTSPIISLFRSAPTVAVILILYAFIPAKKMSVIVGFLIGFPVLYSALHTAVSSTDRSLLAMAKAYRVSPVRRIAEIYLPLTLPALFDASRSTLSLTLKVVVAAEILTLVPLSLGGKIQTAYASFEISYLLAWTLLTVVLAFIFEGIVAGLKKLIVRW
ncbi:MAG: ABC transporter permease subunit [Clostridia bacterium]|nr:ABC transporter permease subunit [Clostridia bacterium]